MLAAIVREYGPPNVVDVGSFPDPVPAYGQVLVRVRAASLNPLDTKLRAGDLRPFLRLTFPAVLGFDFAGEIIALDPSVGEWAVGDRVYGRIDAKNGGTHAELAAVGANVIDSIPGGLSFEEAAALPLTGMTAIQALEEAGLFAGRRLLVNGAAGGVGSLAVQVGRAWEAEVTGVCRSEDLSLVAGLGAARVLDYTKGELDEHGDRYDVILDTAFSRPIRYFTRLLDDHGTFVTTGFSVSLAVRAALSRFLSRKKVSMVISKADGDLMITLSDLVESGRVRPVVDSTYPLERIADAYAHMETEHTRGKIVITIGSPS